MPAITDPYAVASEYRAAANLSDSGDDAGILINLTAISRYIENLMSRTFNQDAEDTTRIYVGPRRTNNPADARSIFIDDIVSVTTLKVDTNGDGLFSDETELAVTDFELWPLNAAQGSEARPFTRIELPPSSSTTIGFPPGARIQVVGIHGWPAVPAPVKQATIEITRLLRLDTARAKNTMNLSSDRIETIIPEARTLVFGMLKSYQRADNLI